MINCVIVDDEPLAREGLIDFVNEIDFLKLAGTSDNPVQLIKFLENNIVDLIFLDIQMPKMTGLEFLNMYKNPPMIIITTAFSNYAVEGFRLSVLDYLLKPITFDRFFMAVTKAKDYQKFIQYSSMASKAPAAELTTFFFIKCGNKFEKILYDDVLYIESLQNYVNIFTTKGKFITLNNLKNLDETLAPGLFVRVHKSYMVAVSKIETIEGNEIVIQSSRIPLSRTYRENVLERVVINGLWNKK